MNYGEEIVFTGGINSDDEARVVPKGDYRDFHYCRLGEVSGKGFCVVTSQGTKEVFNYLLEPDDKILGGAAWQKQNAIIYFVYKDVGADEIWKYDIATEAHDLVIDSTILNFSPDWPIYHANIIDDILKWTDGRWEGTHYMYDPATGNRVFNPPFQINIQKALDNFYSGIKNELRTFDAVKWPMNPPSCVYGTDTNRVDNKLRRKLFKFMVQPIYENGETGVWSMYSNLPIPTVNELVTGTNWLDPKTDNFIKVTFFTGPKNIRKINVAVQQFDETSFGAEPNFGTFLQLDKETDSIDDDVFYTVDFYGDAALSQIADLFKNYDRLPIEANCQEFLPTNQLTYVNFREGFEKIQVTASATYNEWPIDYRPTASSILLNSLQATDSFDYLYITTVPYLYGSLLTSINVNDTYSFSIYISEIDGNSLPGYGVEVSFSYTISQADYNLIINNNISNFERERSFLELISSQLSIAIVNKINTLGYSASYNITPGFYSSVPIEQTNGNYVRVGVVVNSVNVKFNYRSLYGIGTWRTSLPPATTENDGYYNPPSIPLRLSGVQRSMKKGARHQFGIVYGDRAYRDGTVYTSKDMEVFVSWPSEQNNTELPYYITPEINIFNQPPIWATRYWIVARQNTQIGSFAQYALTYDDEGSPAIQTAGEGKFRVYIDNYYEKNNLGANINYSIAKGDVVRFLWNCPKTIYYGMQIGPTSTSDIQYYNTYIECEVLDYYPPEEAGRQSILISKIDKNLISSVAKYYSIIIEIYRPQPSVVDNDVFVSSWRDITPSFPVDNAHTNERVHGLGISTFKYYTYFNTNTEEHNYIDVEGQISLEPGTQIIIYSWTGPGAGNEVIAQVDSVFYPSNSYLPNTTVICTKIYISNLVYSDGSTETGLKPFYTWSPTSIKSKSKSGQLFTQSIYGAPQSYNYSTSSYGTARITPIYGDVYMRQRMYGTGVSQTYDFVNFIPPSFNVEYSQNLDQFIPSPGTNNFFPTYGFRFTNTIESYPPGTYVTVGNDYSYTQYRATNYTTPLPGDYEFESKFKMSVDAVGSVGGDLWISYSDPSAPTGYNQQLLGSITIPTYPTYGTFGPYTTNLLNLQANSDVFIRFERTDIASQNSNRKIYDLFVDVSGNVYVVGQFDAFGTSYAKGVVKLNNVGAVDTTFSSNIGVGIDQNFIWSITPLSTGDLIVAGGFSQIDGTSRKGIAKISNSGVLDLTFNASTTLPVNQNFYRSVYAAITSGIEDVYVVGNRRVGGLSDDNGYFKFNASTGYSQSLNGGNRFSPTNSNPYCVTVLDYNVSNPASSAGEIVLIGGNFSVYGNYGSLANICVIKNGLGTSGEFYGNSLNQSYFLTISGQGGWQGAMVNCITPDKSDLTRYKIWVGGIFKLFRDGETYQTAQNIRCDQIVCLEVDPDESHRTLRHVHSGYIGGEVLAIAMHGALPIVGGDFTSVADGPYETEGANAVYNNSSKYLTRLKSDGSGIDPLWTGCDINQKVRTIQVDAFNSYIYIGGDFTAVDGESRPGVARLFLVNGALDTTWDPAGIGSVKLKIGANDTYFKLTNFTLDADIVQPAPPFMYWYIEDRNYSDFWRSDVHDVGRFRIEDPNAKTVHRKASAIHSDSLIFGTQVNGLSSFGLDNQNIVDLNPVHGEIVRCITSGREGKTLKCLQPNKENSIYIQFYPNQVGDTSNLRVSDKTFSTWFDYKSLFGTTEAGGVALLPDGTTIYFDPIRGAFIYSDMNGQRVISETAIDSQVDYKFRTKTKELAKRFKDENGEVRTYVNEKMGEVGFAFRFIDGEAVEYVHVVWDYIRERWRSTYDYNAAGYLNFGQTLIGWNSDNEIYLHNDPDSINFHGKTDWMQKITFVANEQPNVLKRFQNITLRSDNAFDVTATSTSNYNYGVMETEMPSSMFVFYEGYGKSYYRKNKNTPNKPDPMINGEDMRGDALTHTLSFEPNNNDKSRTLFSVGISGVLS